MIAKNCQKEFLENEGKNFSWGEIIFCQEVI